MNVLGKQLHKQIQELEQNNMTQVKKSFYSTSYHLMPPVGWLNDPNGLCQYQGDYHVFFQYSPFDVHGGLKLWGHYKSKDLIHFEYMGAPILPDQPFDCHGVYSGSALVTNQEMVIYYTGNVKHSGDYDYITTGRGSNVVMLKTKDGEQFGDKVLILNNEDYPSDCTAHVRDPKVFACKDGLYRMVLGARLKSDQGAVLLYQSKDMQHFEYEKTYTTKEKFGYMWECPDYFSMNGKSVLSISPQGLTREDYQYQNIYQSGYFLEELDHFKEWDMGFDFYAPQTFEDEKGRRILIGWAGLPDVDKEYTCSTVADGWQHCLTMPRVLSYHDGKICQYPIDEIKSLRGNKISPKQVSDNQYMVIIKNTVGEISISESKVTGNVPDKGSLVIGDGCTIEWKQNEISLSFDDEMGVGRKIRHAKVSDQVKEVQIYLDMSIMEIYINHGETVMTSRFFPKSKDTTVRYNIPEQLVTCYQYQLDI